MSERIQGLYIRVTFFRVVGMTDDTLKQDENSFGVCISHFSVTMIKYHDKRDLNEKWFILAHSSRRNTVHHDGEGMA